VRYAVLSDVHSNIDALDAAFGQIREDDAVLCLGDIVGYGPNPNECVERIRARATATVLGNHDVAAIDDFGVAYFNPAAREAMKWTQGVLTEENRAWLDSLGYEFRMPEFLLVHGAPANYFEYVLDKPAAGRAFKATDAPLIFGSIGQPRDLNPRASFAFYDPGARTVTIVRVEYPIARVQEKIASVHLPEALARRLVVGR